MAKRAARATHKISPQFMARLSALATDERVQAIVMVQTAPTGPAPRAAKRQSPAARASAIQHMQQQTGEAFTDIDAILAAHGGERLSPALNLLGTLSIRATRNAILALAELSAVKAVIEDQALDSVKS